MTTEMNPSTVTVANPAEQPAKPDVSPTGPLVPIAEKTKETGCCETGAKPDAKTQTEGCSSTVKPATATAAAETCAPGEKSDKPAGSCAS